MVTRGVLAFSLEYAQRYMNGHVVGMDVGGV